VEQDAGPAGPNRLAAPDGNGRKVCATSVLPEYGEHVIDSPDWSAPAILPTGPGGFEIANFSEFSAQERHKHERAVEFYTVLEGRMEIYLDDGGPYTFDAGDELVVLPGTIHEIVQKKMRPRNPGERFDLLVRVHVLGCYGAEDKYVQFEQSGEWRPCSELSREERSNCFRLQARQ
jgi:mannose-6-phosphate isomerase-like protein (cupin superfamily)